MPSTIGETLDLIVVWYNDPTTTDERAQLLSKMAVLELCGWLEGHFDAMAMEVDSVLLRDSEWVEKQVIATIHGFDYLKHLRPMLRILIGEAIVRRVEITFETNAAGNLDRMKSMLGTLWRSRCEFAHSDLVANIARQRTFNAPSWARAQFNSLEPLIDTFRDGLRSEVARL